jgi:hypothetical protein
VFDEFDKSSASCCKFVVNSMDELDFGMTFARKKKKKQQKLQNKIEREKKFHKILPQNTIYNSHAFEMQS